MDILKELFLGNLSPDIAVGKSEEYKKARAKFCTLADAFEKSHDKETVEKFNAVIEANTDMFDEENEATFKIGFTLGVRLMCACLFEDD